MSDPKTGDETQPDWYKLLDHSRSMFIYHAGQRLNSTRYFFAIYGVIIGAYISVFKETGINETKPYALAGIAVFGFVIALVYFLLDLRNAELVHVDENAMHFVERQILAPVVDKEFKQGGDFPNGKLAKPYKNNPVETVSLSKAMHKAPKSSTGIKYGTVMFWIFLIAIAVPLGGAIYHLGWEIFATAAPAAAQGS
ncbi:MAG: hypothetical protein AAFV19_21330 [Pseudomonadota bacterium]